MAKIFPCAIESRIKQMRYKFIGLAVRLKKDVLHLICNYHATLFITSKWSFMGSKHRGLNLNTINALVSGCLYQIDERTNVAV